MKNYSICTELACIKRNYDTNINLVDGLFFRQKDTIRMIEFYTNSKYMGELGQKDELGRDKPFNNIINGICDVENAAKDIDTADISITSDDGNHFTDAYLLSVENYEWMKETKFGKTLNEMRDIHTRYGSLLVKKCLYKDEDGSNQIRVEMPEWKNTITDQVDIINSPIAEIHWMRLSEIVEMTEWNQEYVDEVVGKYKTNGYNYRIPIFEVRGIFPVSFIKELNGEKPTAKDKKTFTYQLYYLAGEYAATYTDLSQTVASVTSFAGKLSPLYWEDKTEKVYKYLPRKKRAGRAFGVGVPEEGEEAQVWTNDTVLKQHRAMEYTTKVVVQSASKKLKGRNMLNEVDDGQILEHEDSKPITAVPLLPAGGLGQFQPVIDQWFTQFERATSAYSAQRGESPTSRTSFKLQSAVLQQSGSVMETIQEDFAMFVAEIFEDWILPFEAKNLNTEHILSHEFSLQELKEIDKNFSIRYANAQAKEMVLSGKIVTEEQYAAFVSAADSFIKQTKNTRFLQVPKDNYKKILKNVSVNITNERRNKKAVLESLSNIMMVYAKNPQLINDPVMTQLFMKIVEISGSGISPVSLVGAIQEQAKLMEAKQKQQAQDMAAMNAGGGNGAVPQNPNPAPAPAPTA